MILRSGGFCQSRQRLAIVPGHPFRRILFQLLGVPLQLGQIVEGVDTIQLAGVYQTHEQIADSGAVQRLIKECILAVQNRFFQGTLDDVVIDRCAWLPEEERQLWPVIQ
jgi:hypothetical protein